MPVAGRVFDEKEVQILVDSGLDFWLTTGRFAEEFEKLFEQSFADKAGPFALVQDTVVQATQQALGMMVHTDVHLVPDQIGRAHV